MNFSFKNCLKTALIQAIGQKPDFEIILAAAKWVEKGVLVEADVLEIQAAIDKQYVINEETVTDVSSEENMTENFEVSE